MNAENQHSLGSVDAEQSASVLTGWLLAATSQVTELQCDKIVIVSRSSTCYQSAYVTTVQLALIDNKLV